MASNQTVDSIDFSKKCFDCGMTKRSFEIPAGRCKLNSEVRKVYSFSFRVCGWLNDAICDRQTIMFLRKNTVSTQCLF